MTASSPVYCLELLISHPESNSECLIALEQLYLRKQTVAEYPLLERQSSAFKGVVAVSMAINGCGLGRER